MPAGAGGIINRMFGFQIELSVVRIYVGTPKLRRGVVRPARCGIHPGQHPLSPYFGYTSSTVCSSAGQMFSLAMPGSKDQVVARTKGSSSEKFPITRGASTRSESSSARPQ